MKILLLLGVILSVGLVSAQEPPPTPTKHPKDLCLDEWNACVESADPDNQFACLPKYYECLNVYTRECRKKFRNRGCYEALGQDECKKRLRVCYGLKPE